MTEIDFSTMASVEEAWGVKFAPLPGEDDRQRIQALNDYARQFATLEEEAVGALMAAEPAEAPVAEQAEVSADEAAPASE